ncbi:MAG TPA: flavodoxin [Lachnospiraceae bacterium]|nr:flavodoxin [Lachnospiraceae bacterium]
MAKKLAAFFSASGVTKQAAGKLAKQEGEDLFEIKPVQPYTKADPDWTNKKSRSTLEMTGKTISPFATSGGSGYGRSNKGLEPSAAGAKFNPGRMM